MIASGVPEAYGVGAAKIIADEICEKLTVRFLTEAMRK
jgi:hypothetical protein